MSDTPSLPWQRWLPDDLDCLEYPEQPVMLPLRDDRPQISPDDKPFDQQQYELEQIHAQARNEAQELGHAEGLKQGYSEGQKTGYDAGYQQGLAEAQQQQAPLQARMQQLVSEFHHAMDALDSVIPARLMQLSLAAARQVIGEAPQPDSTTLLRQIQEMLQQEPMFSGNPTLRVHPDDLPHVEQSLGATLHLHGWRLLGDSTIHPGGCKVNTEEGDLDASIATRWHELCRLAAPGER